LVVHNYRGSVFFILSSFWSALLVNSVCLNEDQA